MSVEVPDFKKEHNHFCNMYVKYSDDTEVVLRSRVLQNLVTKNWVVDGMKVLVDVTWKQ